MTRILPVFLIVAWAARAESSDAVWSQWRGPLGTGSVPEGDPPIKWDEKTNVKWKVRLPGDRGSSTPAVWGNRVFVQATEDTGKQADPKDVPKPNPEFDKIPQPPTTYHRFVMVCYDRDTGKELWRTLVREAVPHEGFHPSHSLAGFSPVTDGERVYGYFGSQGVYCFTPDGEIVWERHFPRMETRRGWGEGGSPVLADGILVVPYDHEGQSFIVALNAETGETVWKKDRDEPTCWATPFVLEEGGRKQVIVNGTNFARSYDLKTGEEIWRCGGQTVNAIPSPLADETTVYCMSGYRGTYAAAIPRAAKGDLTRSDKLIWEHGRGTPYVPSPLLMDGRLYFTQGNGNQLSSVDAKSGKVIIDRERLPDVRDFYASPVGVKDRIYLTDRNGTTLVIKAGTDEIEPLATNRLDDEIDASPVVIGDQILLRGHRYLYCIKE